MPLRVTTLPLREVVEERDDSPSRAGPSTWSPPTPAFAAAPSSSWRSKTYEGPQPRWHVRGTITKSGRPLQVPTVPDCALVIRAWWEALPTPARLLFGDNTDRRPVKNQKRTVVPHSATRQEDLKATGVGRVDGQGRRADFHSFRYTFCRLMGERFPIQKVKTLMGHSTIKLTADLYGEPGMEDVAEDVWTLAPLSTHRHISGHTAEPESEKDSRPVSP